MDGGDSARIPLQISRECVIASIQVDLSPEVLRLFRSHTDFPARGFSVPAVIPRIAWSDDWAFWQEGYPAISVTDTAYLRYTHYHTTEDTPDKLCYEKMAIVVDALSAAIRELADR